MAGLATYGGNVGGSFAAGYTLGGLANKGIDYAGKKLSGVDLSHHEGR